MDEQLQQYISQCRQAGISDDQIRTELLKSGWDASMVDASLPQLTEAVILSQNTQVLSPDLRTTTKKMVSKNSSRFGAIVIAIVLVLLQVAVAAAATIAVSEKGYAPEISKVYRQSLLPLAWNGTTGRGSISVAQALYSLANATALSTETNAVVTITKADGSLTTTSKSVPYLNNLIALSKNESVNPDPLQRFRASVNDNEVVRFPIVLEADISTSTDKDLNTQFSATVLLDSLRRQVPLLGQYLNAYTPTLTIASKFTAKPSPKFYFNSNFIPRISELDEDKYFVQELDPETVSSEQLNPEDLASEVTRWKDSAEGMATVKLLDTLITDNGIIRKNNVPLAHYSLRLDATVIEKHISNPDFDAISTQLRDLRDLVNSENSSSNTEIQLYINPANGNLVSLNLSSISYQNDPTGTESSPLKIAIEIASTFTLNGEVKAIETPTSNQEMSSPFFDYIGQLFEAPVDTIEKPGVLTRDAISLIITSFTPQYPEDSESFTEESSIDTLE